MEQKSNRSMTHRGQSLRKTERLPTYLSDGIRGRVSIGKDTLSVSLIDITPFGVGVVPNSDLTQNQMQVLKPGTPVQFQYTSRNTSGAKLNALIAHLTNQTIQGETRLTFGLAFLNDENTSGNASLRRKTERFQCSEFFRPHAVCGSPYFFGERAFFSLTDISSSGCSALTSARNKFLSPNMEVTLTIVFPLVGTFTIDTVVRAVSLKDNGKRYQVNMEFKDPTVAILQAIGEYLVLINPKIQPEELRRAGLRLSKLANVLSLASPSSHENWDAILEIRKKVAAQIKRNPSNTSHFDRFDPFARNLMVKIGERIVGTGRVLFLNGDDNRSEAVTNYGFRWPEKLEKYGTLEVTFPAIDPDYNRTEAFEFLMRGYLKIAIENDAQILICAAPLSEANTLETLGFENAGLPRETDFRGVQGFVEIFFLRVEPLKKGTPSGKMTQTKFDSFVVPVLETCGMRPAGIST